MFMRVNPVTPFRVGIGHVILGRLVSEPSSILAELIL